MKKTLLFTLSTFLCGLITLAPGQALTAHAAVTIPSMELEDYPVTDGSLACMPLLTELCMKVTGCNEAAAEEAIDFSNTNPSYINMAKGTRDLLLSYEPSSETKQELEAYPALTRLPVGRDALVFIVNADNPVDSLTKEQIAGIYRGDITDWSEVGGTPGPIAAFQRNENSGSQTLMRLLLMGDDEMPAGQITRISTMEGLLDIFSEYDNSAGAIGYSVYYYASVMNGNDSLKFLSVEGTAPDNDTIRSGEYPLTNPFYCVTGPSSSEAARKIQRWLISDEGQQFVEECGYVGAW